MLLSLLLLAQAAAAAAQPLSLDRAARQAGEAYGMCLAAAAQIHSRTTGDMDATMAHAMVACVAEREALKQSYRAYLRSIGVQMSDADYDRMIAESMPQVRQRIAGCLEAERFNAGDGGRRTC